jgi:hypothetical protein
LDQNAIIEGSSNWLAAGYNRDKVREPGGAEKDWLFAGEKRDEPALSQTAQERIKRFKIVDSLDSWKAGERKDRSQMGDNFQWISGLVFILIQPIRRYSEKRSGILKQAPVSRPVLSKRITIVPSF